MPHNNSELGNQVEERYKHKEREVSLANKAGLFSFAIFERIALVLYVHEHDGSDSLH